MENKVIRWSDLDGKINDCTLARLMDFAGEDAGKWPEWSDPVPEWVKKLLV